VIDQTHTTGHVRRSGTPSGVRHRRAVGLTVLAAAQFMVILDSSITNVALPSIQSGLKLSSAQLPWVVDGYLIAFSGLLLLGGRLADVLRRREVFLVGLALFTIASAACALAPGGSVLIGARVAQGAGAAVMAPAALSLVMILFPDPAERARALGLWGGVSGAGGIAGVLLGGVLSQTLGWPSIFLINVPVGVVVCAVALYAIRPLPAAGGSFDALGAVSVTVSMAALSYSLVSGPHGGWTSRGTLGALAIAIIALAVFIGAERRSPRPLVPLHVLARARLAVANAMMLITGGISVGFFFFLPQYQQHVLGMSPMTTSLAQLPLALSITAGSLLAPRLARVMGMRTAVPASLTSLALGLAWLAPAGPGITFAELLGPFVLIGLGLGMAFVHLTTLAVTGAEPGEAGLLSGLVNTTRQMGGALGLAALVALTPTTRQVPAFTSVFLMTAAWATTALLLSLTPALTHRPGVE
jgi:EmrB/QacA subfamily drug resistance transporter